MRDWVEAANTDAPPAPVRSVVTFSGPQDQAEWLKQVRTEVRDAYPMLEVPNGWVDLTEDQLEAMTNDQVASLILSEIDNATIVVNLRRKPGGWQWSVVTWGVAVECRGVREILTAVGRAHLLRTR